MLKFNTKSSKRILCLIPIVLAASLTTFGVQAGDEAAGKTNQEKPQAVKVVKDQWTAGLVEGAFLFNPHLNNFSIDVEAQGDTVILTGTVATKAERSLAEQVALSIDKVDKVDNQIIIAEQIAKVEPESDNALKQTFSDATITTKVKTRLLANSEITGLAINVDTRAGEVTLSGEVESGIERDLAYYVAKNTSGVVKVTNQIEVAEKSPSLTSTN